MRAGSPAVTPVAEVEISALFRRLRRLYWWSLGLAFAAHLVLIATLTTVTRSAHDQVAEPAKVKFFTRRDHDDQHRDLCPHPGGFHDPAAHADGELRPPPHLWRLQRTSAAARSIQPAMGSMSMLSCASGDFSTIPS